MILPFLLSKANTPEGSITKPILILAGGQSNEDGYTVDPNPVGWLQTNHPELLGLKSDVYVMKGVSGNFNVGTLNNDFTNLSIGHNQTSTILINTNDPIDTTQIFPPICVTAVLLNNQYNVPVHYVEAARGATQLKFSSTAYTWNSSASVPDAYSSYRRSLGYFNEAITQMNTTYGVGNWDLLLYDWNQGENDVSDISTYETDEYSLFQAYQSEYGSSLEFICSGVKGETALNALKIANAAKSSKFTYFSLDDIDFSADGLHYSPEGHYIHGLRSANVIINKYT